ncbi:uncharacterized protein VTP21DRAFT_10664 [Calcarisporiella thermophila]|uniref:uncharacterized protein n=1 Tax=Calcarisporiella thermophila TaxID=911321 RepID=UPI00374367FF
MSIREEGYVVIETGSYQIRAGINVHDTNRAPSVEIGTRVAKLTVPEALDTSAQPSASGETPAAGETPQAEADKPKAKQQDNRYVVGNALTELLREPTKEYEVIHPIKNGLVENWEALEALWHHILFKEFALKKSRNESPVLLAVPSTWTKDEYERVAQIFFESFNSPGIYITEQPLLALYGAGSVTGLVIDIGHETTDITPVIDSIVQHHATQQLHLGGKHLEEYLLRLLSANEQIKSQLEGKPIDLSLARHIKESGVCRVIPPSTEAEANAEMEVTLPDGNGKLRLGEVGSQIADPLFRPELLGKQCISLQEAAMVSILACEPERRPNLWDCVVVTGGTSLIPGLRERVQQEIEALLAVSENPGETQSHEIKPRVIPEYFTALKDTSAQHYATYLGGAIVAKLLFPDAKNYTTKVDYNERGPSVVHNIEKNY